MVSYERTVKRVFWNYMAVANPVANAVCLSRVFDIFSALYVDAEFGKMVLAGLDDVSVFVVCRLSYVRIVVDSECRDNFSVPSE